ncbi:hypothetical protein VTH06DRAFT_2490 [Thermothelomyces fergusii]
MFVGAACAVFNMLSRKGLAQRGQWPWLLLCLLLAHLEIQLVRAESAIQTLFVPDSDTIASFNVPPESDDINFYLVAPDWYQYTAIGFGTTMSDALMLVMYPSADRKRVTVSPRKAKGNAEPVYSPDTQLVVHDTSIDEENANMVVNATCRRCLPYATANSAPGVERMASMMFAVGPELALSSNDLDARIRRHVAYGKFEIDLRKATGKGGIGEGISGGDSGNNVVLSGERGLVKDSNGAATAHGILYAVVALAIAPFDSLVAGALGTRWAWVHGLTASAYLAFVVGALVPGIIISREHVATQQFRTGHQVLGLLTVVALAIMFVWGIGLSWIKRSADKRGQEPPEKTRLLCRIHQWTCRTICVLLLVNVGLGLKLSEHKMVLIFSYLAVALAVITFSVLDIRYYCLARQAAVLKAEPLTARNASDLAPCDSQPIHPTETCPKMETHTEPLKPSLAYMDSGPRQALSDKRPVDLPHLFLYPHRRANRKRTETAITLVRSQPLLLRPFPIVVCLWQEN